MRAAAVRLRVVLVVDGQAPICVASRSASDGVPPAESISFIATLSCISAIYTVAGSADDRVAGAAPELLERGSDELVVEPLPRLEQRDVVR